jgi:hypothetical protein
VPFAVARLDILAIHSLAALLDKPVKRRLRILIEKKKQEKLTGNFM